MMKILIIGFIFATTDNMNCMEMVDKSDYVIAVWNGKPSGTGKTIRYAIDSTKPVYYVDVNDFKMKAI